MVERLKQICAEQGITVTELERRAGLPDNSIYKWDRHSPSVNTVAKAARVLNVTVDSLIAPDEDDR